jgi:hypothetical protein
MGSNVGNDVSKINLKIQTRLMRPRQLLYGDTTTPLFHPNFLHDAKQCTFPFYQLVVS